MSAHDPIDTPATIPPALLAALDRAVDQRLKEHGLIRATGADHIKIGRETFILREMVGRPPVLVQVSTGREVELPAPAHPEGQ